MRTKTFHIETNSENSYPVPKEWLSILNVSINGMPAEYMVTIVKTKKTLSIIDPPPSNAILSAHVKLKDQV